MYDRGVATVKLRLKCYGGRKRVSRDGQEDKPSPHGDASEGFAKLVSWQSPRSAVAAELTRERAVCPWAC